MRSGPIVVVDVGSKHPVQMGFRDDQREVQALCSKGLDPSLGVGIGVSRRRHLIPTIKDALSV